MRYEVTCEVAAPVETVWSWWTDFGEPGTTFRMAHGMGSSTRTILARDGTSVVFSDKSLLGDIRRTVKMDASTRTLRETGEEGQTFESEWRFEPLGVDRTRITRTMRVRAAKIYGPFSRWVTRKDLAFHCREAEREIAHDRKA